MFLFKYINPLVTLIYIIISSWSTVHYFPGDEYSQMSLPKSRFKTQYQNSNPTASQHVSSTVSGPVGSGFGSSVNVSGGGNNLNNTGARGGGGASRVGPIYDLKGMSLGPCSMSRIIKGRNMRELKLGCKWVNDQVLELIVERMGPHMVAPHHPRHPHTTLALIHPFSFLFVIALSLSLSLAHWLFYY